MPNLVINGRITEYHSAFITYLPPIMPHGLMQVPAMITVHERQHGKKVTTRAGREISPSQ